MGIVQTYKNDGIKGVYSQIKLDSSEKVLISIGRDEIKIFRMKLGGLIPGKSVWHFSDLYKFTELLNEKGIDSHPLDVLVEKVKAFSSIEDLQKQLAFFVEELKK
jgi:hypothetical protein